MLSKEEMRRLLMAPKLLKHRLVLGLLYGCGLRCFELRGLMVKDIDFDRGMVHVRQGKGGKDRYVPLSKHLARGLQAYIYTDHPSRWLFNGNSAQGEIVAYSQRGVQWVVREARKAAGLHKEATAHTLRHTYATAPAARSLIRRWSP